MTTITPQDLERFEKEADKLYQCPVCYGTGTLLDDYCGECGGTGSTGGNLDFIKGAEYATLFERELAMKFAEWLHKHFNAKNNGWSAKSGDINTVYTAEQLFPSFLASN